MKPLFSSTVKSGLIALGLISGITAPSTAGPIMQPDLSGPASTAAPKITPVRDSWAGGNDRQFNSNWQWRRHDGRRFARSGNWDRGNWNRRHWNRRHWNGGDDWRWRQQRRYYRGGYYNGGGYYNDGAGAAILGLGLGLGLGSMYNNYNYYDAPAPRRYYRAGRLSNAHVQWCYNRYRSYRTWDNTFQPYNGPRQQCWSPYS
ncbi:BA14K family protein [Mesorhizobium sp.]|uniref:BA14K family protein n=1 Tax=Mesorhizobium sp. TaxID=1871066 RepID=UPI000FE94545|nr:BA14K family protein [Mesorhizobium sp.]RWP44362.1 MAG: BA14K family protein [Mesorhizobium sp.]RWP64807.1 MAG: BA14K family protein [Mesorhizobium sp.]TIM65603.1 MAG: BA14K family protein [Mesorhizobium sp.]